MRLLLDQNLSYRLTNALADIYPECSHVSDFGLEKASDTTVWNFARDNGFAIVSKDADFHQRSLLLGCPPKVVWLRIGNCSTKSVEALLRKHQSAIAAFETDSVASFLALDP